MEVYTTGQVANMLNVSSVTIRKEIERGNLVAFKVGVENRITKQSLERYMGVDNTWEEERKELIETIERQRRIIEQVKCHVDELGSLVKEGF